MSRCRVRQKLERWRALAGGERRLLVELALFLPAIGTALRLFGVRRTCRLLGGSRQFAEGGIAVDEMAQATAKRLGRLVNIASRHGPYNATCLRHSLALWWLLRRRGLPAELHIGVGKEEALVRAHAWVELGGLVVNDRPSIAGDYAVYQGLERRLPGS